MTQAVRICAAVSIVIIGYVAVCLTDGRYIAVRVFAVVAFCIKQTENLVFKVYKAEFSYRIVLRLIIPVGRACASEIRQEPSVFLGG